MKKTPLPLLTIILLVLSQPIFAAQWRPIAEITDFERRIITQASRKQIDPEINKALAFRVKNSLYRSTA